MYVTSTAFNNCDPHRQIYSRSLPVETLLEIFKEAAGDYIGSRKEYLNTLESLLLTCKRWHSVLYRISDLWATLELQPHRKRVEVTNWMNRLAMPGVAADLRLRFDDLFSMRHLQSTDARLSPFSTIRAVRPILSRCRRLLITCDQYNFPHMIEALQHMDPSHLMSLTLHRVVLPLLPRREPPHRRHPGIFLHAVVPSLLYLRVIGTSPGWDDLRLFRALKIFVAHAIPDGVRPSGIQTFTALDTMRFTVERMSLRDVCYDTLPWMFNRVSTLWRLVELDLYFKSSIALAQILARLNMPALRIVTTYFDTPQDLQCLIICSSILANVVTFGVTCNARIDRHDIGSLWVAMPLLTNLDLSRCGGEFFDALFAPGMPYFFPLLRQLTVAATPPTFVRVYLQRRLDAHLPIRRVTLWRIDQHWFAADINWMIFIMGATNVIINPTGNPFTRSWILHY